LPEYPALDLDHSAGGFRGASLISGIAPGPPEITVDRLQIKQLVVNLIRNPIDALQGSRRRELTARAAPGAEGAVETAAPTPVPVSHPRWLTVCSSPSSQPTPTGWGVGLSICCTIVEAHDGALVAEPNPAGGTISRFSLPVSA